MDGESYRKSKIEKEYYEHVIDEVESQYQDALSDIANAETEEEKESARERARALRALLNELKSHRDNKEDLDKFLYDMYGNGFSISGAASSAYKYDAGIGSSMKKISGGGSSHLSGVSCSELQELMDMVDIGKEGRGIKNAVLPYIANVTKHWFYEDIEFTVGEGGVYRASHKAKKDIKYDGEGTVLENYTITIWNALLTDEDGTGIFYQVNEPYVHGPNEYIEKLFHEKYYRYDGTIERAHAIAKAELLNKGYGPGYTYIFNGEKWQLINSNKSQNIETNEISDTYDEALPEKQQPSFGTPTDTLSAFNILKQVQTEDSDAIYRMLKELATSEAIEGHLEKESILEDLKRVLIWPFYTDNDLKKWNVSKDLNEYGIIIDDVEGEQIVMPGDGTITTDGDKVIIEFDTLKSNEDDKNPGTVQILTKKYVEDDFYRIDPDIVKGKKMIIQGITLDTDKNNPSRGEIIGVAGEQVKIVMQREDKSIIGKTTDENADTIDDDVENYVNQNYTIHDEDMVIKSITEANGVAAEGAGAKTSDLFANLIDDNYNGGGNSNYINRSESTPVDGPLAGYVGDDMDLVYAIVAAECSSGRDMYESAYAVISCIVNRLGNSGFKNNETMTSIVKSPGQWSTFTYGNYLAYYPKSELQASRKSAVIQAVDDCIRTGVTSHGFNFFHTSTESERNKIKSGIQSQLGTINNWDKYCREIGGNFYYKTRGARYIAEDD